MANYWNHSEIRIVDDHNDDKEHGWKRVDGTLFYAQYISGVNIYEHCGGVLGKSWKGGWYELPHYPDNPVHDSEDDFGYYKYYERALQGVLEAGDETSVHRNQGEREAIVLAVAPERGQALVEYEKASEFYPENPELPYWSAVTLASKGNLDQALPIFREVFQKEPRLRILTPRLVNSGLLPNDPALIEAIIQIRSK